MRTGIFGILICSVILLTGCEQPPTKIRLQLKWVHQAQFAGYYVAKDKGWYADAGLDVEIEPGGPGIQAADLLREGRADVAVEWMSAALRTRNKDNPLVHIAQPFQETGMRLVCRTDRPIYDARDLAGKNIGHWPGEESILPLRALLAGYGLTARSGEVGLWSLEAGLLEVDDVVGALDSRAVDCIVAMSYNEVELSSGEKEDSVSLFSFADDFGIWMLEDGLYVLEDRLQDEEFVRSMQAFVCATMRGWQWAVTHQDEAVEVVMRRLKTSDAESLEHQTAMLEEVSRLVAGYGQVQEEELSGALWIRDYERTVNAMVETGLIEARQDGYNGGRTDRMTAVDCTAQEL